MQTMPTVSLFSRLPIPESIRASAFDVKWRGTDAYVAPTTETPLQRALLRKTNAGVITFIAGCVLLGARRLEAVADTQRLHHLAEVLLCFTKDPRSYSGYRRPKPANVPHAAEQAVSAIFTRATGVFQQNPGQHGSFPPMQAAKNVVALLEVILGAQQQGYLRTFLETCVKRLDHYAANMDQVFTTRSAYETDEEWMLVKRRNFGAPVPIEVLDPSNELKPADVATLFADFMSQIDGRTNPYLSPAFAP
jgi:hypothetical protein